jgi:hypothetical protein
MAHVLAHSLLLGQRRLAQVTDVESLLMSRLLKYVTIGRQTEIRRWYTLLLSMVGSRFYCGNLS